MTAAARGREEAPPLRLTWILLAAALLTGFFAYLRFPYDRVSESLSARFEQAGVHVEIGRIAPSFQLAGLGWQAEAVQITRLDGTRIQLDRVRVRPAWSLAWLMLRPALHIDLESPLGGLDGTVVVWRPLAFQGTLRDVNLAELKTLGLNFAGTGLEGHAQIDIDLAFAPEGPQGVVHVDAKDGVVSHPELPMAIPYEQLQGEMVFGGPNWVAIPGLELKSPLGHGTLSGTVGQAPDPSQSPLALKLAVQVAESIRGSLGSQGVRVGRNGEIQVEVTGTTSAPIIH